LEFVKRDERVSFSAEVKAQGLPLCPCDMNRNNFMKDKWGRIVAVDFGACCFLPLSFFALALREGDHFTQLIAKRVKLPELTQLNALLTASYALVPFNTNNIGEHISLLSFFFLPLVPLQGDRAHCTAQVSRASSSRHGAQAVPVSTGPRPPFSLSSRILLFPTALRRRHFPRFASTCSPTHHDRSTHAGNSPPQLQG
jgi:hypothetical protein